MNCFIEIDNGIVQDIYSENHFMDLLKENEEENPHSINKINDFHFQIFNVDYKFIDNIKNEKQFFKTKEMIRETFTKRKYTLVFKLLNSDLEVQSKEVIDLFSFSYVYIYDEKKKKNVLKKYFNVNLENFKEEIIESVKSACRMKLRNLNENFQTLLTQFMILKFLDDEYVEKTEKEVKRIKERNLIKLIEELEKEDISNYNNEELKNYLEKSYNLLSEEIANIKELKKILEYV